jgi:hypothetical protein
MQLRRAFLLEVKFIRSFTLVAFSLRKVEGSGPAKPWQPSPAHKFMYGGEGATSC